MKLYVRFLLLQLGSQMQYKVSFLLTALGQFFVAFSAWLGMTFLFARFGPVQGFSLPEVMLSAAVVTLSFSLAESFARGFDRFPQMIRSGSFDRVLLRPRSLVFQVLAGTIEFSRLGKQVQGVLMLMLAVRGGAVDWTPTKILLLLTMIVSGSIVFFALFLIYAAISFYTLEGLEFVNIFTDGGREFGIYPLSFYRNEVLRFFTYVVPLALFQYYPLLVLLGRSGAPLHAAAPLLAPLFLLPAYGLWRVGLRRYQSSGS